MQFDGGEMGMASIDIVTIARAFVYAAKVWTWYLHKTGLEFVPK
jgi:hypothetical protein